MKTEEREHLIKTTGMISCSTCGDKKDKSLFAKDKSKLLGYSTQCKECKNAYRWAVKHIEKHETPSNIGWFAKFKMWLAA